MASDDADRLRDFERAAHTRMAPGYDAFFSPVTALATSALLDAAAVGPGQRVLDVACGPGRVAARASERGATATGVDLAPGMVALARGLHPHVAFREAGVEALPFDDGAFDALVCSFGLGHFPDPELAVAECSRVVAPGGRLAFAWWDDPSRHRLQALFREAAAEIGAPAPANVPVHSTLRFCDTEEFRRLLEGAGLAGVDVRGHTTEHRIPDVDALWEGGLGSLAMTAAAIVHQPGEVRARIRSAFERRAAALRTEHGLTIPVAFLIGSGRKPA
ncbi:MAG: methyltransferase domain-containing protein [Acetobacteraceae bacterium]|nr:methyltransferase domain-containing protein [Acetobacteraceae bacterium]